MSISTVAQVRSSSKSHGSARTLLLVIASHVNPDTGWAWPSLDTLAHETGLRRRRTIDLVHLLEVLGELEVRRGYGRGHVNFYRVHVTPEEKVQSVPGEKVQSSVRKGAISRQEKVQSVAPKSKSEREKKGAPRRRFLSRLTNLKCTTPSGATPTVFAMASGCRITGLTARASRRRTIIHKPRGHDRLRKALDESRRNAARALREDLAQGAVECIATAI